MKDLCWISPVEIPTLRDAVRRVRVPRLVGYRRIFDRLLLARRLSAQNLHVLRYIVVVVVVVISDVTPCENHQALSVGSIVREEGSGGSGQNGRVGERSSSGEQRRLQLGQHRNTVTSDRWARKAGDGANDRGGVGYADVK